ncbi:MAG: hypothetical protein WKF75_02780 [Singulisphaera sp.]
MGRPKRLWLGLAHQPDPRLRARLIDTLTDPPAPPVLRDRLGRQARSGRARALLLGGRGTPPAATSTTRVGFVDAARLFLHDPIPASTPPPSCSCAAGVMSRG